MPLWDIDQDWKGQDAVLIGGGSSLQGFDFNWLKGRNVLGVNDAFRLGPEIVKICLFGDASWFHRAKWDLEKFKGRVVSCAPALLPVQAAWLWHLRRVRNGIHAGQLIGWNFSTGAAAINVAVSLGAVRLFLLGYDLSTAPNGKSHWHTQPRKVTQQETYSRFGRGFINVFNALKPIPNLRVFNVTDGSSKLPSFPRITFANFRTYVPPQNRPPIAGCAPCAERAMEARLRLTGANTHGTH